MNTINHHCGRAITARAAAAMLTLLQPNMLAAAPSPPAKSISNTASMGFGRFVPASGGTINIDANGVRTRTGGVVLLTSSTSTARYTISNMGNDNRVYILSLPANGTVALTSGARSMALNNFVSNAPPGGLLPGGAQSISVGATLQVAPNQGAGNYTGSFQVTLEYQ